MRTCLFNIAFVLGVFTGLNVWAAEQIGPVIPTVGLATSNTAAQLVPQIRFANTTHDFGKITGGEIGKADFYFTNTGTAMLEVTDVKPGCGCTTAGEWTKKVEPGKSGIIPLKFNSANFVGSVAKSATVTCNDPAQPTTILTLKANIWRPIEVNPQWAILNVTTENPSNATTVHIVNNLERPLKISDLECKTPGFSAELKTVKEGKEFEVFIKTVPPFPTASVQGQVTMKTDATNMPTISISTWANVQQTIMVMPAQIALQPGPLPSKVTQTVSIRSTSTNLISITDPVTSLKGVELQLTNFQAGRYFVLSAVFPAGLKISQAEKAEITLKSTHPQYPEIKIPVIQTAPPPPPSPLTLNPQYAILYLTPETPSNAAVIRITNHTEQAVSITGVQSRNPAFGADLKTLVEGKEYELTVKTLPPFPSNSLQGQITMQTTAPSNPTLTVTAWANYQQSVMAMPPQITLPSGKLTNAVTQTVWIRNNGTNALTLSDPEVNVPGVDVKVNTFQQGKYYNVSMTFPAGTQINPEEKLRLTVKTSHPKYPEIKVPIVQPAARAMPPMPGGPGATMRAMGH